MKLKKIVTAMMVACSLNVWAGDEITVGTYNIRMGGADGGTPNAWSKRKSDLVKFIAKLDMDVFGMQEVMPSQARYITNSLPQYAIIGDYREANRVSGEASSVCYRKERFDVLKSGTFWLSETPDIPGRKGWGAACPRVCTWAILKDRQTGKAFTFANAHTDHKSALARREGMLLIIRRMKEFSPSGVPIIFTGDHNCRETDEPAMAVSKILVNSFYASKTPPEGSWRTISCWKWCDKELPAAEALKLPIEERNAKTFKGGARIDYIYVSKDVEVLSHKTHSDPRPGTQLYPSDHFPVTAKLALPPAALDRADGVYADWALTLPFPDNNAGWLRLYKGANGEARASLMWRWTGPNELIGKKYKGEVQVDGQNISIRYLSTHWIKKAEDQRLIELKGGVEGDAMTLVYTEKDGLGNVTDGPGNISGRRIPALDKKPDVSKIRYGEKIDLMDFSQWELRDPALYNGWSVKDGVLSNRVKRDKDGNVVGKASSLITKRRDFKDFLLTLEVRMPHPGANSGVYLRGNYEIQLLAKHTDKPGVNDMGALYGYVAPKYAAEKEIGEWQQMSICLYKRHVTVKLNGTTIIDNEKVEGCTGGALSADLSAPGPIWLQGDHTDVDIRKFEFTEICD